MIPKSLHSIFDSKLKLMRIQQLIFILHYKEIKNSSQNAITQQL